MQDIEEGTLRMHRKVTSEDVEDYASHVPGDEVKLDKEENIVYKKGMLTHGSGTVAVHLVQKVSKIHCFYVLTNNYTIRKSLSFFPFPGMITSVFMSLLLEISYLKPIYM